MSALEMRVKARRMATCKQFEEFVNVCVVSWKSNEISYEDFWSIIDTLGDDAWQKM